MFAKIPKQIYNVKYRYVQSVLIITFIVSGKAHKAATDRIKYTHKHTQTERKREI